MNVGSVVLLNFVALTQNALKMWYTVRIEAYDEQW